VKPGEIHVKATNPLTAIEAVITVILVVFAVALTVLQYPRQDHSKDHLAELFTQNIYRSLEKDAIIITDHWDFQSTSYYLQLVRNERPDIVVIDKSLLRGPMRNHCSVLCVKKCL
jgi:endo-alpha-1,4-polygalactosaminidase (GH114 family)